LPPFEDEQPVTVTAVAELVAVEAPPDQKQEQAPAKTDAVTLTRTAYMRFLGGFLKEVKAVRPTLDAFNLFGVDLMLAGAADLLGQQNGVEADGLRPILQGAIEAMGVKADTARTFADKYESYLGEPRYLTMVQSGRNAMDCFLAGTGNDENLGKVFAQWNKPQQATQTTPRIMTIIFTDMVGSTDLTQARGDQAAQHIVRRHNSIVRSALADHSGKEIKHTGDGIMASFASAANGVEASIAIQKAIATHNVREPSQDLHVRIGINAGEPIEEEEDLFGGTVQLAARVCAKCDTDDILCTNVVRELSSGKGLVFVSKGAHTLKGFREAVPLYKVEWRR
jgi:class 3 adenylate cyclase